MIPTFPQFTKLTIQLKKSFEQYTHLHDPYSDHNFISLLSYDVFESFMVSSIHENLVIQMTDYITHKPFLTFIGTNNTEQTIQSLLQYSSTSIGRDTIRLIPEHTLTTLSPFWLDQLNIEEDRDSFDYVLSVERMKSLQGPEYRRKRNEVRQFLHVYPRHTIRLLDLSDGTIQQQILHLFIKWKTFQNKTTEESITEQQAIERLLKHAPQLQLETVGIFHESELIGFCITEILPNNHVIAHFAKTNYDFHGITPYLFQKTAEHVFNLGARYWNNEQDLGIEGMRKSKESWAPIKYLKKYSVKKKN